MIIEAFGNENIENSTQKKTTISFSKKAKIEVQSEYKNIPIFHNVVSVKHNHYTYEWVNQESFCP